MSQENVEAIHRLVDAFNAHDVDRMLAESPGDRARIRFVRVGGVYRGYAGLRSRHPGQRRVASQRAAAGLGVPCAYARTG